MKWHVNSTDFVLKLCTWTSEAVSGVLNVIQKTQVHSGRLLSISPRLADHGRKIDDFFGGREEGHMGGRSVDCLEGFITGMWWHF